MEFLGMKKRGLQITSFTEKWESTIKEHYPHLSRYVYTYPDTLTFRKAQFWGYYFLQASDKRLYEGTKEEEE